MPPTKLTVTTGTAPAPPARVPPSVSPAVVARFRAHDRRTLQPLPDPDIEHAERALSAARSAIEALNSALDAVDADQSRTAVARALAAREILPKIAARGTTALDDAGSRLATAIAQLEERLQPAAPRGPESLALASEVRARLAAMPKSERDDLIAAAAESGDEAILGPVLRAHPMLSGLRADQHQRALARWRAAHGSDSADRLARLQKAAEALKGAGTAYIGHVEALARTREVGEHAAAAERATAAIAAARGENAQ